MTTYKQLSPDRDHWDCALIHDLLPLFIDDEVNPDSRSLIVEHLSTCSHCADFFAGAQSVQGLLPRGQIALSTTHDAKGLNSRRDSLVSSGGVSPPKIKPMQKLFGVICLSIGIVWLGTLWRTDVPYMVTEPYIVIPTPFSGYSPYPVDDDPPIPPLADSENPLPMPFPPPPSYSDPPMSPPSYQLSPPTPNLPH